MTDLTLSKTTADRMGYERVVAATCLDAEGILIEYALIAPEDPNGSGHSAEWTIAIHQDCDPDEPSRGVGGLESCGPDRAEAERLYLEMVEETKAEIKASSSAARSF